MKILLIQNRARARSVIRDWLGADDVAVLGSKYEQLGFVTAPPRRRAVTGKP